MKTTGKIFGLIVLFCTVALCTMGQNPKDNPQQKKVLTPADSAGVKDTSSCGSFEYGGKVYHTVIIGKQCWMKENLNVGSWIDMSQNQAKNGTIEKYCPANDFVNCDVWGGLYQWEELMHYQTTAGAQGICPAGWHVPDSKDWKELLRFLGGNEEAGGKMKSTGNAYWGVPNVGASNSSQFTALPGGYLDVTVQHFVDFHNGGYFWSSETISPTTSVALELIRKGTSAELYEENNPSALSVRCIQD